MKDETNKNKSIISARADFNLFEFMESQEIDFQNYKITMQISDELNKMPFEPIVIKDTGESIETLRKRLSGELVSNKPFQVIDLPRIQPAILEHMKKVTEILLRPLPVPTTFHPLKSINTINTGYDETVRISPEDWKNLIPKVLPNIKPFDYSKMYPHAQGKKVSFKQIIRMRMYQHIKPYLRLQRLFRQLHIHEGETYSNGYSLFKVMSIKKYHFNVSKIGGDSVEMIGKNSEFANFLFLEFTGRSIYEINDDVEFTSGKLKYLQKKLERFIKSEHIKLIQATRDDIRKLREKQIRLKREIEMYEYEKSIK